ncbi:TPA: hypothetical protein DCL30_05480 [Candidatus Peribacteria bacterium]|nr:MAG: hypothetical protein A3J91_01155 [Candidatus Peribacteria bacterium RIFOXYC2_FULL_58_10]OGJ84978.1 MAG: hypothetical protein A2529_00555 [Candidatus Peribacteria bacterium RIFOXYD2_FULL_58_15]HAI98945.1 hypothetical protein [Candidatus Peribacteria bacterium]HAS34750.1 hypothetical protein [Candidatus Peribacteria bacterium]
MKRAAVLLSAILLSACTQLSAEKVERVITLRGPGERQVEVSVEIVESSEDIENGLMFREGLANGHGMLFRFDPPREEAFWMKNVSFPLDVIFFDAGNEFESVQTMVPCTDPCPIYRSIGPIRAALEVPAGFTAANGIRPGWKIEEPID